MLQSLSRQDVEVLIDRAAASPGWHLFLDRFEEREPRFRILYAACLRSDDLV